MGEILELILSPNTLSILKTDLDKLNRCGQWAKAWDDWAEATFTVIWCPQTQIIHPVTWLRRLECGICGTLRDWNVKYFVLTPDILWMNQTCDHLVGSGGRIYPIPGDPATSAARVETGLPSPAQSWVTFVFSSRPWKVLAALGQPGLAGVTSRPHGATEMGGKGMMTFPKPVTDHYMHKNKPRNHIEHIISFSEILNKASITNIKHSSPWGVRGMRRQFWSQ